MLVGRDRELQLCRAALARAVEGQATSIEIVGEPGIGKTALLAAVAVADERFRHLRVTAVPAESVIAYAGLEALLRPVAGWIDVLPAAQQPAIRAALRLDGTTMPDPLPLVGCVLTLLAAVSADHPLILTVDDGQWLDDPSSLVLEAVGRRLGGERIVMITASRDEAGRRYLEETIRLTALQQADADALLRARRPELAATVIDELRRRTDGNPLSLVELADDLTAEQAQGRSAFAELNAVPRSIEAVHLSRIAAVSPAARELLMVVACAGPGEIPIVLGAARELGLAELAEPALDELAASGLVTVTEFAITVQHPLLRTTVVRSAGLSGLRRAHLSLAQALKDIDPDRALWHRAATPLGPDDDLAVELTEFAERLVARAQPDSARRAFQAAVTVTGAAGQRCERLVRAAEVSLRGTNGAATATLLAQLRPLTLLTADQRLRVGVVEAWTAVHAGRRGGAALLDAARGMPVDERSELAAEAVAAAIDESDYDTARSAVDLLLDTRSPPADSDIRRFNDLARLAVDYLSAPTRSALPDPLRAALARPTTHVPTLSVLRDAAMEGGDLTAARSIALALAEVVRARGDVAALANATLSLAFCDHALVNWNSAASRAFEVTQLVQERFATVTVVQALLLLADIDGSRGRAGACRAACARVRILAEDLADPRFSVLADRHEALLDLASADPSVALQRLAAAERRFRQTGLRHPYVSPVPDLVEMLVRVGRRDDAAAIAPRFFELVGETGPNPPRARALRIRGLLADDGSYDELFDAAIGLDLATGQSFHAARTMLCQGERRRRDGRRVAARERLDQALDIFSRVDAEPWVRRTESELTATGATAAKSPRPTVVPTLTNQELQIATLVAEGQRNSDIAAALYLSVKTVEFHLTRAYRKAGVSNRTQLASLMKHPQPRHLSG